MDFGRSSLALSASSLNTVAACAAALALYWAVCAIRDIYFHPLAAIPGPKTWIASRIPYVRSLRSGRLIHDIQTLHAQYGPVVRFAVNEVSFIDKQAWADICGHHGGERNFARHPQWYQPAPNGAATVLSAGNEAHARIRRLLAHAFSERALKAQEKLIQVYPRLLIERLRAHALPLSASVSIKDYFQFTTFDIAGDLEFGAAFGCLEHERYHHWLAVMLAHFKRLIHVGSLLMLLPTFLRPIAPYLVPRAIREQRMQRFRYSQAKVSARLAIGEDPGRADFMTYVCRHNGTGKEETEGMTIDEIEATFDILVVAGSETTATTLTAALHYLLRNPHAMQRLRDEISAAFRHKDDLTLAATASLPYLTAVVHETLRMAPPAPTMQPRIVPAGGAQVCGYYLPAGTGVSIPQWATFRSSHNFARPNDFLPERWMSAEQGGISLVPHEAQSCMPFSFGPRVCLGKSLAWAEIRLILSNLLWHFDLEWQGPRYRWEEQKAFVMWEKEPLMVKLSARRD